MNNNGKTGQHVADARDKQLWDQNEKQQPNENENTFMLSPPNVGTQNFDSSKGGKEGKNGSKIFQQYIAPQNHLSDDQQLSVPAMAAGKKHDQSTHLSNLGKQAMAKFGTDQKVIDT